MGITFSSFATPLALYARGPFFDDTSRAKTLVLLNIYSTPPPGRNGEMAERTDDGWYCLRCGLAIFGGCGCDHGEWQCDECGEWTYPFYYDRSDGCSHCGHEIVADTVSQRRRSRPTRSEYATYVRQPPRREEYRNWDSESGIRRVADGVSNRIHRLRCLGNAVVPQIAHFIGTQMLEVIDD